MKDNHHQPYWGRSIWIIDDDENDNALVEMTLRRVQPKCAGRFFSNAALAVEALAGEESRLNRPALIVCDVKMAGMSGFDFLAWLRSSAYRTVPVVMRSASENRTDVTRAYELGANSYLVKPVLMEEAEAQFQSLSRFWFQCCNLPPAPQPKGHDPRTLFSRPEAATLLAHLKVAFTAAELEVLVADQVFEAACGRAGDSPEDLSMLVKLGGAVLAARSGRALKLDRTLPQCDPVDDVPEGDSPAA